MSSVNDLSLSTSFELTIQENLNNTLVNLTEVGLDSILEDGVLKDIPFISTAVALFKVGSSIKERHEVKKLGVFLQAINDGITNEEKRRNYARKFAEDKKMRDHELEYLLIILERYLEYEKPVLLAQIYLAYLDGKIDWNIFAEFSVIIDRFIITDLKTLFQFMCRGGLNKEHIDNVAAVLRLLSLGIVELQTGFSGGVLDAGEINDKTNNKKDKSNFDYYITDTGTKLTETLTDYLQKYVKEK